MAREALTLVGTRDQARVAGALRDFDFSPIQAVDPSVFPEREVAVAVVDPELLGEDLAVGLNTVTERLARTPIVFLSGACPRPRLAQLCGFPETVAIVPREHVSSDQELSTAIHAVRFGPTFGWQGVMAPGMKESDWTVADSEGRTELLDAVADFLGDQGVRRRLVGILQDVTEELVTNAIYDAPTDGDGRPLYAALDRRKPVVLPEAQRPVVRVAVDETKAAVCVDDPFGSLAVRTVRRYLAKGLRGGPDQIDSKQGGAGLGLTRVYELVDQLIVRVAARERTQVVCVVETGGGRRDMASRPTSLLLTERGSH